MSLINQALKRAQEAQAQTKPEPLPELHFRPVETPHRARHTVGLVVPISLAVVALLLLFLVWQSVQQSRVTARGFQPAQPENVATKTPATQPVAPVAAVTPIVEPSDHTPAPDESVSQPVVSQPEPEPAPPVVAPPPPPPKPAPPRLQGIIFNPTRPSAVINGKTLFLGDKFGDQRVVAIDKESATLVGGGQTNVLTLEQ